MKIQFIVGSSYDAEYEILEYGHPLHGRRFRVYHRADPAYTPAGQAESNLLSGYLIGYGDPLPLDVARAYNAHCLTNWQAAMDKYGPDFCDPAPFQVKGVAQYVSDSAETGHYLFHDLEPDAIWRPAQTIQETY